MKLNESQQEEQEALRRRSNLSTNNRTSSSTILAIAMLLRNRTQLYQNGSPPTSPLPLQQAQPLTFDQIHPASTTTRQPVIAPGGLRYLPTVECRRSNLRSIIQEALDVISEDLDLDFGKDSEESFPEEFRRR
jgi:hypothetical protein